MMSTPKPIKLREGTVIKLALAGSYPVPIVESDEWGDLTLWAWVDECGIRCITAAESFESAYYAMEAEQDPVADDEIHEAYGFATREEFDRAVRDARDGVGDWPEITEGYAETDNGPVHVSYDARVFPLCVDDIARFDLTVKVGRPDSPDYCYAKVGDWLSPYGTYVTRGDTVIHTGEDTGRMLARVVSHASGRYGEPDPDRIVVVVLSPHGFGYTRIVDCAACEKVDHPERLVAKLTAGIDSLIASEGQTYRVQNDDQLAVRRG